MYRVTKTLELPLFYRTARLLLHDPENAIILSRSMPRDPTRGYEPFSQLANLANSLASTDPSLISSIHTRFIERCGAPSGDGISWRNSKYPGTPGLADINNSGGILDDLLRVLEELETIFINYPPHIARRLERDFVAGTGINILGLLSRCVQEAGLSNTFLGEMLEILERYWKYITAKKT